MKNLSKHNKKTVKNNLPKKFQGRLVTSKFSVNTTNFYQLFFLKNEFRVSIFLFKIKK